MRQSMRVNVAVLVAGLVGLASQPAGFQADAVTIKDGSFIFEDGGGILDISGNHGFRFNAGAHISGGTFQAWSQCQVPECHPGTVVNLDAGWSGTDLNGTARLKGTTYEAVGDLSSDSAALVEFSGTITMPPMTDGPVSITVPFEFVGSFFYNLNVEGEAAQSVGLRGGGHVTLDLRPLQPDPTSWEIVRAVFEFTN